MFTSETGADKGTSALTHIGETLVGVRDVTKRYGHWVAVEDLSLTVRAGEVFGLVGANGGGKTTALRILAGILKPDRGHGQVLGRDLVREAGEIRKHIGYMSQRLSLYTDLTVHQNLRFRAEVYGLQQPGAAAVAVMREFELEPFARSRARQLSGGWARRLQLAAALIHSPRLIFLDEPTAGLDAASKHEVWRRIEHLAALGAGVIVSSHDLAEAERCSRAALLSEGRIVAVGTPDEIARSAPASAFLLSGVDARRLQESVDRMAGIVASYPQGASLRIVANTEADEALYSLASTHNFKLSRTAMRLEDAVLALAFSKESHWRSL
jgi:ABC-2 type transport system ATP-binding protein